ncbi:MAG: replicative DNA helicase [Anaerolineae bacterium]
MADTTSRSLERNIPSNPDAEQAVLGALLLDPDAITRVAAFLQPPDFYLEKHAWIYEAILDLHDRREPIDLLSVISSLDQRAKLGSVGGSPYLTVLLNSVPTAAHVEHYGRLVEAASVQRQLLQASTEIAGLAYEGEESLDSQISRAEQIIFDVANRRQTQELIPIRRAVDKWIDRIDYLREHQGETLGVQSGFADLDKVLGGLQKSDLIIVAGRPGSGKTSFALSICYHAAVQKRKRIAIFSLEMSAAQLVERLMAQVADVVASEFPGNYEQMRVDSQSLRLGNITDEQWSVLARSTGMLSEAEIYIDETSLVTPLEIRSKCRRLAAETGGLDLVIVDYLQLMTDRGHSENRVQEMSNISRQLKFLAREIDVPVVALSQLSRAVESRTDRRPQLSDLRESGCLAGETPVYLPDQGAYRRIDELVGQSGFNVLALNPASWQLERRRVLKAFPTGHKPVYRLTTRLGRTLRATANHQFLTIDGWKRLDELHPDIRIALPRQLSGPEQATMSDAELGLLGHLIGDGCTLPRHAIQYTTCELGLAETVANLAGQVFGDEIEPRIKQERNWYQVYLSARQHLTHNTHNPITAWLKDLGVFGLRSFEKRVPESVFAQPASGIARFLRHLWATDGCIHYSRGVGHYASVYYASSSPELAQNVQSLLLRLGINAVLRRLAQTDKGRDQYHVVISGKQDIDRFISQVGALGAHKTQHQAAIVDYMLDRPANTNRDVVPREVWRLYAVPAMQMAGITTRQMQASLGNAYCGTTLYKQNISRDRAARLAEAIQSQELARLAESDVYWDEISSIEPDGETEVYDLTVEGLHNFIAGDMVVHNSIEQDADIVVFIYREKIYYPTEESWSRVHPNKPYPENLAEIIVAKHRHGPTTEFNMFFDEKRAKFKDLAVIAEYENR